MRKLVISLSSVVLLMGVFVTGVAAGNGWSLSFTGEESVNATEDNIDKIMDILKDVDGDKKDALKAVKDLEKDIEKKDKELSKKDEELEKKQNTIVSKEQVIDDLEDQIEYLQGVIDDIGGDDVDKDNLKEYVEHLESELNKANNLVDDLKDHSDDALDKAKKYQDKDD